MIDRKKVLAIIPARGGSKGVPRKNLHALGGKPLIAWTIEAAKASKYIDRLILSSDDDEIMAEAKKRGCDVPFKRPAELATDATPGIDPVLHALGELPGFDYVVLLQPTSPLRIAKDIDDAIELCVSSGAETCVSVAEPSRSPYWMSTIGPDGYLKPLFPDVKATRRQDLPQALALNGAVYVASVPELLKKKSLLTEKTAALVMPDERSVDIDGPLDFRIAEAILHASHR